MGTAAAWVGGISMTLEGLQFAKVGYRSADIDDVILNTGGAIIAFVAWRLLRLPRSSSGPRSSPEPLAP
ncbi:MAG TPA: VanZ family protein [Actinomycetota bacterium]|nr:VanZ family protein [Actinomycetota bacterium]